MSAPPKSIRRPDFSPQLRDTAFLTRYFNHLADLDRGTFRMHAQEVHGERWRREWAERKGQSAAA